MSFLTNSELNMMERDYKRWMDSAESCDVVLSWVTYTDDPDDVYGDHPSDSGTPYTSEVKAIVQFITKTQVEYEDWGGAFAGDGIFFFKKTVDLLGKKKLRITMPEGGVWAVDWSPPEAFHRYSQMSFSGKNFVQAVFARREH